MRSWSKEILAVIFGLGLALAPGMTQGEEIAWVLDVDRAENTVFLETVQAKIRILIGFADLNGLALVKGGITPLEFECARDKSGGCDYVSPFEISVQGKRGKPLAWRFLKPLEDIWVAHALADSGYLLLHAKVDGEYIALALRSPDNASRIAKMKRGQPIKILLKEDEPEKAYVEGTAFDIVAVTLSAPPKNK